MSHFIIHEASDADYFSEEGDEEGSKQESNFIDDSSIFSDQGPSDYRQITFVLNLEKPFENVESTYEDAMKIADEVDAIDMECDEDFSNFVFGSEPEDSEDNFDEYGEWEKRIKQLDQILKQKCEKSTDSFFNAVLWGTYFKLKGKNATFDDEDLKKCLGSDFLQKLNEIQPDIILNINLDTFEQKMHLVNDLLCEKNLFLHLFEKKTKFKYVFKKGHEKTKCKRKFLHV